MKRFGLLFLVAALAAAGCNSSSSTSLVPPPTQPAHSIQHIVILLQENRSFNNFFMGFPGATTATPVCARRRKWCPPSGKVPIKSVTLESTNQFALGTDISHSHGAFEVECDPNASNVCQNDGFDLITFGQALYGPPAKLYPYRAVEALRNQGVLGLRRPVRARGRYVLHRDGEQLHRASADHRRDDAAERERVAHRSARRTRRGAATRRRAPRPRSSRPTARSTSSAVRSRASRSIRRWPIYSTPPASRGSSTSPRSIAPIFPAACGTASMRSARCATGRIGTAT